MLSSRSCRLVVNTIRSTDPARQGCRRCSEQPIRGWITLPIVARDAAYRLVRQPDPRGFAVNFRFGYILLEIRIHQEVLRYGHEEEGLRRSEDDA
jgi:hypothetical protein